MTTSYYMHFNPRPPARGATERSSGSSRYSRFQSTPPARGATESGTSASASCIFQSTPPARGATTASTARTCPPLQISIHAPREGGDLGCGRCCGGEDVISIHAPREGGDSVSSTFAPSSHNFNPRPPRGGRRMADKVDQMIVDISIHAPREGGDSLTKQRPNWRRYFNPRPPRGGRQLDQAKAKLAQIFQSTPPARGATIFLLVYHSQISISIHAPREGGDAYHRRRYHYADDISIHAPREGGDCKACY